MDARKLEVGQVVCVGWLDAHSEDPWHEPTDECAASHMETYGVVTVVNEEAVKIASSLDRDLSTVGHVTTIPMVCVEGVVIYRE